MKPYRKIFVQNPSFRMDMAPLEDLSEEVVVVCRQPMFDELAAADESNLKKFEGRVVESVKDFDPEQDAVAFFGDAVILTIMTMCLMTQHSRFRLLRWSTKANAYIERWIDEGNLEIVADA